MNYQKQKYTIFAILCIALIGCKDNIRSSIPDYPVYLELRLSSTYPTFRNSFGQTLLFDKPIKSNERIGYGGIAVCTGIAADDYGNSQYFAFDMACPFELKKDVIVYQDTSVVSHLYCKKCGSVFDISFGFGNPISGPAKEYLKKYKTSLSNDVLYVTR